MVLGSVVFCNWGSFESIDSWRLFIDSIFKSWGNKDFLKEGVGWRMFMFIRVGFLKYLKIDFYLISLI